MKTKLQLLRSPEDLVKAYLYYYSYGPLHDVRLDIQDYLKNNKTEWSYAVVKFFYKFKQQQKRVRSFLGRSSNGGFHLLFTKDMINFYTSIYMLDGSLIESSKRDLSDFVEFDEIEEFI